jgi:hypothetical protein
MKITHQQGDPVSLTLLEENARFFPRERFEMLVKQIKKDGVLQQWPFVWYDKDNGRRVVLSGNHRIKAAIQAGLSQIDWTECDENLSKDERLRIQLGHNAIVGEDDPAVLRRLYESIEDAEERVASGIDDAQLQLFAKAETDPLSEVNLDFMTVLITFLPDELDRAQEAFDEAKKMISAKEHWLAKLPQHDRMLAAIEDTRNAAHIKSVSTVLDLLLDVWDEHRESLRKHWLDDDDELKTKPTDKVPVTTLLGTNIDAEDGQVISKAMKKTLARGQATDASGVLRLWADTYLEK